MEKAERTAHNEDVPFVIASVQSLSMPERLARFQKNHFDLIITDEVHRGAADSYRRVYDHFCNAKLVGLTATPFRSDGKSLGDVYDEVCFDYDMQQAINDGYLCPVVSETIPLEIDLSGVDIGSDGDFKKSDLEDAITPVYEAVAKELRDRAGSRKIVVFLPLVSASKNFADVMGRFGFAARHVDGKSKDRDEILEWFDGAGPCSVLCNSSVLIEGWDCPSVDCVVDLTPTRSTQRYIQKIGRGTRLSPETGKENLYVPDFLWHGANHNLCHPAMLIAKTEEVANKMVQIQSQGGVKDIQQLEEDAHAALVSDREEQLANNLKAFVGNKSQKFDPVLQSVSLIDDSLQNWSPETKGEALPASDGQVAYLEKHGFDASGWKKGYASRVIDIMIKRNEKGLASPKQVRCLLKHGYPKAHNMTFKEASEIMDKLTKKWNAMKKKKWKKKK